MIPLYKTGDIVKYSGHFKVIYPELSRWFDSSIIILSQSCDPSIYEVLQGDKRFMVRESWLEIVS